MKRTKSLFNQITSYENVRLAWTKARKGKMDKPAVKNFARHVNENLTKIQQNLKSKPPVLSQYTQFKIFDPKERVISVVPFLDRVMHHAIMNVLESVFERQFIYHTYACRKGKGSHRAVQYVFEKAKKHRYFLKLDVKKYFDNIDHEVLKKMLGRIIKDRECLNLLFFLIDSYGDGVGDGVGGGIGGAGVRAGSGEGGGQKGLPIGNLTSQFFANFYLSALDHFVLEKLKPAAYVRYMDDILIIDDSKENLAHIFDIVKDFCGEKLFLTLKTPVFGNFYDGCTFLGFLIRWKKVRLSLNSRRRKRKKFRALNRLFDCGVVGEEKYCERVKCLLG